MTKFQVDVPEQEQGDVPEEGGEERPQFSFRGADPVNVGDDDQAPSEEEASRQLSLTRVLDILIRTHDGIQGSDEQLFELACFVTGLKTGEVNIADNKGKVPEMVQIIRKRLLAAIVALDQALLVADLEERGILGQHDDRVFARCGLAMAQKLREGAARWGLEEDLKATFPEGVAEAMRQAVAQLEEEEKDSEQ